MFVLWAVSFNYKVGYDKYFSLYEETEASCETKFINLACLGDNIVGR